MSLFVDTSHPIIGWVGNTKVLKHAQFLCQFYELRKLNAHTGVEGCGFVAGFGQYTDIAFLVSLLVLVLPYPAQPIEYRIVHYTMASKCTHCICVHI